MGIFVNPGNDKFRQALNSKIYVDKSGLISVTNERLNSLCFFLFQSPETPINSRALG